MLTRQEHSTGRIERSDSPDNRSNPRGNGSTSRVDGSDPPLDLLTNRERDVLELIAVGLSVKEIASELELSTKSVDSRKYRLMKKLQLHDRVQLCRYAIRQGLIDP